jgi:hypothetical protein
MEHGPRARRREREYRLFYQVFSRILGPDWTNSEPLGGKRSCKSPSACSGRPRRPACPALFRHPHHLTSLRAGVRRASDATEFARFVGAIREKLGVVAVG